jgi:hypothetical protein
LSPDTLIALNAYLSKREEDREPRKTYAGNDASAELICFLCEALLSFEQLRLEVTDQIGQHQHRGERLPPRMHMLMTQLLSMEPLLVSALSSASDLHGQVWSLNGSPFSGSGEPRKGD